MKTYNISGKIANFSFLILLALSTLATPALTQSITQIGTDIDGEAAGDESGYSVSLSADGQTVAIGARFNDDAGFDEGHVRIFQWDGSAWTQIGDDIDGEADGDESGYSVSLSADGQTVAIGAPGNDDAGINAGHVRIFQWDGTAWTQIGADIDGDAAFDQSGYSVSLSADGQTVAIGVPANDDAGNNAGHVRIFQWDGSAWTQIGADIDGEADDDLSGYSVSLSADGQTVAIGANANDDAGNNAGHVRIFQWDGSAWTQIGADIDGEADDDFSGYSVSLSADGQTVAIGAPFNDDAGNNAGHVRIFQWDGTAWTQIGADIDGDAAFDLSGFSVSLSADGQTVAIGANANDDAGNNAGHVRIFQWDGSAWTQIGDDIDGEAPSDFSGLSVSLSADGQTVAIGAPRNDNDAGTRAGHVRIYSLAEFFATIPTMGQWGLMILGLLLTSMAVVVIRKNKTVVG